MLPMRKLILTASLGAGIASFASVASTLPVFDALAIRNAAPPTIVEEVQWRGRWGWGWGWGAPVAAGMVAGALVGGAFTAGMVAGALVGGALAAPYKCSGRYRPRRLSNSDVTSRASSVAGVELPNDGKWSTIVLLYVSNGRHLARRAQTLQDARKPMHTDSSTI
jgi:hypothetical protein